MFSSDKWFSGTTGFYSETIDQSLRFEDGDSPYLTLDAGNVGAGNRKTFTLSFWIKFANLTGQYLFSSYGSNSDNGFFYFSRTIDGNLKVAGFSTSWFTSTAVLRDTTNFYHIVLRVDSDNETGANIIRVYVNGTLLDGTRSNPSDDFQFAPNTSGEAIRVGANTYNDTPDSYVDGYMAEVNFLDGQSLAPTSFAETKNGVWIPKAISGLTYGTNGFRLTFSNSSDVGENSANASKDLSSNGLASTDIVPDSPTNNFPTLNVLDKKSGITLSEGNLKRVDSADAWESITAPFGMTSGKYYAEFIVTVNGSGSFNNFMVGVVKSGFNGNISDSRFWSSFDGHSYHAQDGKKVINGSGTSVTYGATWTVDDIIGVALNLDDGEITFYKNNVSQGVANTGLSGEYVFACATYHSGTHMIANFGQDSSFAGNETAQNNSDANGIGDFYYTPPSGFLALCSSNLSDTTLSPNQTENAEDYFISKTYSGDSNTSTQISTGFQPDWVWIKNRTEGSSAGSGEHMLYDSSRGVQKDINTSDAGAEDTNTNGLQEFGSSFFRPGSLTRTNETGDTYVAWSWVANGGTTSSNTNGTITATVQASPKSGFSIVTYTGTGSAGTIGHGLGKKPKHIAVKARSHGGTAFQNYHSTEGATKYLSWFSTQASSASSIRWNNTEPTTDVFSVGTHVGVNNSSSYTYVAYVFAEIEGFSKIDSFTGNNSTDGTFVYTGFKPAWVMIKASAQTESWGIHDNARNTFNVVDDNLLVNVVNAENAVGTARQQLDFTSSGFKLRNAGDSNSSINNESTTYIYLAYAEQPFHLSNAR